MASQLETFEEGAHFGGLPTDVRVVGAELYLIPVRTRVPLKFGAETLTSVTCARARIAVRGRDGRASYGWGETPLNVQWAWPGNGSYALRQDVMVRFCEQLTKSWSGFDEWGHPIEIGQAFLEDCLPIQQAEFARSTSLDSAMPLLAALICCSPFDLALHDAYGKLHKLPTYATYNRDFMNRNLSAYLAPADGTSVSFADKFPADYLVESPPSTLPAWHLVGGLDPVDNGELPANSPGDGYPVLLRDWIEADGLKCLKIKLRGNDPEWDFDRLVQVGSLARQTGVTWLSADFNCMVTDPSYVNNILDRLRDTRSEVYALIAYVEQPFPYELAKNRIDVHSVSARKPLFMDESAHDWQHVRLGRELGWTGVALKTCKTQTGALLSLCWAKAHGMELMVQDLTNPMLAQIPHVLLAAYAGTIRGVETNAMQFYPEASEAEARVHPGLYARRHGQIDLSTIYGSGFGYRIDEVDRQLPDPTIQCGDVGAA